MGKTIPSPPKNKSAGKPAGDDYAAARLALIGRKDKAIADRLGVQNAATRGDLIPRTLVKIVFGRLFGTFTGIVFGIGESKASLMLGAIGRRTDNASEAEAKIRDICTDHEYAAARALKEALIRWLWDQDTDTAE
jgi:hypothetical protein